MPAPAPFAPRPFPRGRLNGAGGVADPARPEPVYTLWLRR
jgi:hypothetical protein